eukprot:74077_1
MSSESSDILFESSLEYFSFRQNKYKGKWMKLIHNKILMIMDEKRNGKTIKRIDLNMYDKLNVIKLKSRTKSKANDYIFLLTSTLNKKKTPYKFRAHSKTDLDEWMKYIKIYQFATKESTLSDVDEDKEADKIIADICDSDMNVLMSILNSSIATQHNNNQFITWNHIIFAFKQHV